MISCEEMEWTLNLYLDDMLPSEEAPALKAHLAECPACRERLEQLRAMRQAVASLDEPVPETLHQRILDYVAQHAGEQSAEEQPAGVSASLLRPRRWFRTLTAVAACVALCVVAVRFLPQWASKSFAEDAASNLQMEAVSGQLTAASSAANGTMPPAAREEQTETTSPDSLDDLSKDESAQGQLAMNMPPIPDENGDSTAENSIRKWLLARGAQEAAPECLTQTTVYEGELEGKAVSYVEIAAFAQDYWLDQLAACGYVVTELEGEALSADGQYIRLYFAWTE